MGICTSNVRCLVCIILMTAYKIFGMRGAQIVWHCNHGWEQRRGRNNVCTSAGALRMPHVRPNVLTAQEGCALNAVPPGPCSAALDRVLYSVNPQNSNRLHHLPGIYCFASAVGGRLSMGCWQRNNFVVLL